MRNFIARTRCINSAKTYRHSLSAFVALVVILCIGQADCAASDPAAPTVLSNSALWFNADDLSSSLANGAAVTAWPSASGTGNRALAPSLALAPVFSGSSGVHAVGGH